MWTCSADPMSNTQNGVSILMLDALNALLVVSQHGCSIGWRYSRRAGRRCPRSPTAIWVRLQFGNGGSSTSRRGCLAFLIWRSKRSRSGGEWPLNARDAGVGTALVAELKNGRLPAVAVQPQVNKKMRMAIQSEKFKSGTILLPTQAPWLRDFEDELAAFPHARHDDQVDALSQALAYEPPKYTYSGYENVDWQGILTNWYLQTGGGTRPW
jgi:hypothetical protein